LQGGADFTESNTDRHNATYITQMLVIRIDFQAETAQFALEPIPAAFDSRNADE